MPLTDEQIDNLKAKGMWWSSALEEIKISKLLLDELGVDFAKNKLILPIDSAYEDEQLYIKCVTNKYSNLKQQNIFAQKLQAKIQLMFTDDENLLSGLTHHYNLSSEAISLAKLEKISISNESETDEKIDSKKNANDPYAEQSKYTKFYRNIIDTAIVQKASDIHLLPNHPMMTIIFRINGVLVNVTDDFKIDAKLQERIINIIKTSCEPTMTESTTISEDGRITYKYKAADSNGIDIIDCRISAVPTDNGQKIVIRILPKDSANSIIPTMEDLGYPKHEVKLITRAVTQPKGIIFLVGPTGSGKSTTLISIDSFFPTSKYNKIHVADPIEYKNANITQIQINEKATEERNRITFAGILRHLMRQDPDVLMVGEIRDKASAEAAISLSVTGHRVLTTIHAGDVMEAFERFKSFGIDRDSMLRQTNAIVAQRLLPIMCNSCKKEYIPDKSTLELFPSELINKIDKFYRSEGCFRCNKTGVEGRFAIGEILVIDNEIRDMVQKEPGLVNLIKFLKEQKGFETLAEKAIQHVKEGTVALETLIDIVPH